LGDKLKVIVLASANEVISYQTAVDGFLRVWASASTNNVDFVPVVLEVVPGFVRCHGLAGSHLLPSLVIIPEIINTAFTAQIGRLMFADTFDSDIVMLCDIDMLPLDPFYFIAHLPSADEVVIYRDVLSDLEQIPICYVAANPQMWKTLLPESTPETRLSEAWINAKSQGYTGERGGAGWTIDQQYLYQLLLQHEHRGGTVIRLSDRDTGFRRLDRVSRLSMLMPILSLIFYYTDCHRSLPVRWWGHVMERTARFAVRRRVTQTRSGTGQHAG
jgi:hypothetical protein